MSGAFRAIDHLDGLRLKAGAVGQGQQARPQFALRQRRELVEERQDQLRVEDEHEELKKIVKDLIEVNKKQSEYAQGLQKQIDLLKDGFNLLRKLNNV